MMCNLVFLMVIFNKNRMSLFGGMHWREGNRLMVGVPIWLW